MKEFWGKYKAVIIGALAGIVLAVLMLTIGFFPTLLIIILGGVGAVIGGVPAIREKIGGWMKALFSGKK